MPAQTITGSAVVCHINGQLYGRVAGLRYTSDTKHRPTMGLDLLTPYELQPLSALVSGTLDLYRTRSDGGIQGVGIIPTYSELPRGRYFTIQLIDQITQQTLFHCQFASCVNESWNFVAKGVGMGSMSFMGLSWNNEVKPSIGTTD